MAFDGITINAVVDELKRKLLDGKIDKINQPYKDEILVNIRSKGCTFKLLISVNPSLPRIYLVDEYKKENPKEAPMFLMVLRKYIKGGRISDIYQEGFDRVINIDILTYSELKEEKTLTLVVEIMSKHSNIILIEKDSKKILDSIKRVPISVSSYREVLPNLLYKSPPSQNKLNPIEEISLEKFNSEFRKNDNFTVIKGLYTNFEGLSPLIAKEIAFRGNVNGDILISKLDSIQTERLYNSFLRMFEKVKLKEFVPNIVYDENGFAMDFSSVYLSMYEGFKIVKGESISGIAQEYYIKKDILNRIFQKSSDMRKILLNKIKTLSNKLSKQIIELKETNKKGKYKKKGDLLTSYVYLMKKGMEEIEVVDFYDEKNPSVKIKIDKNKTPSENIQGAYKKYNKLNKREKELTREVKKGKEELDYLENLELSINNVSTIEELNDIVLEMEKEGILKKKKNKKEKVQKKALTFMKFKSSDGFDIYVGKNNTQNDYLTLKFASDEDLWFHTKEIPGSHVIVKKGSSENFKETEDENFKNFSDTVIKEAGLIAGFYSKGRLSSKVPVDYTIRKNIKKPNQSKPGFVIYETNSTIYVTPDEKIVYKLKIED